MNEREPSPRTLLEPTTGRPILMAPHRQQRPLHTSGPKGDKPCPFCEGHEAETPPEVDAVRRAGTAPNGPGWTARAFPNKYPANAHHEVIAEGARHHAQPVDLDVATWATAITLWQRRIEALESRPGIACTFLFKNVGALAGASIDHNHSQVLGLPDLPPRLALELAQKERLKSCPWCTTMASAKDDGRSVFESKHHVVLTPEPPKLPYETWLLPRACDDDFLRTDVDSLATAMHALFAAVASGLARPAFNLWLHRVPRGAFHWHFELQPRTGQMAGLELGGDMYINSVPATQAAAKLRSGLAQS